MEVECDFNARGELGIGDDPHCGYKEVRYKVSIESPASNQDLENLVGTAERFSPYLAVFSRPQKVVGTLDLNGDIIRR